MRAFLVLGLLAASAACSPRSTPKTAALAIRDARAPALPFVHRAYATAVDVEATATHVAIKSALTDLLARHEAVDLFILVQTNDYAGAVAEIAPELRARLRLVYNTGAGEARQGDRWCALGARAYVGHNGGNVAPIFYGQFLPRWLEGATLADAVSNANEYTRKEIFSAPLRTAMSVGGWVGRSLDPKVLWAGTEARFIGSADLRAR